MRRHVTIAATAVIAALLLPVTVNVATSSLPGSWQPYLWIAWPVSALLAVVLVLQQLRGGSGGTEARPALTQAADALAAGVRLRWQAELESQDLVGQALLPLCDVGEIAPGRVVVLGPPGAGKTVVATVLTLDLLERRAPGDPVPVLLPIARWDPDEHLHDWIARRLAEDHTGLTAEVATQLVAAGLVLPVLDGVDELPAEARVSAVIGVDRLAGPIVLTSRVAEYREALAAAGRVLGDAREVVLGTADTGTMIGYVTRGAPDDPRWRPVVAQVRGEPDGSLATALARPLLAWLARTTYRDPRTDPVELLALTTAEAVEHHLLASFVEARYRSDHPRRPTPGLRRAKQPAYEAGTAREWLRYLALYLELRHTDGFVWWRLCETLPRWVLPLVCGVIGCVGGLAGAIVAAPGNPWLMIGGAVWGTGLSAWFADTSQRRPVPSVVARLPLPLTLRAMGTVFFRMVRTGVVGGPIAAAIATIWLGWARFLEVFTSVVLFTAAIAVPYSVHEGLQKQLTSVGDVRALSPRASLRASGRANLLSATGIGLYVFCLPLVASVIWSPLAPAGTEQMSLGRGLQIGTGFLIALTVVMLSQSDWLAFTVAKLLFAARGIFPHRLMRFLDDAHSRGVLRQVGTVYEFRHARLRAALAVTERRA